MYYFTQEGNLSNPALSKDLPMDSMRLGWGCTWRNVVSPKPKSSTLAMWCLREASIQTLTRWRPWRSLVFPPIWSKYDSSSSRPHDKTKWKSSTSLCMHPLFLMYKMYQSPWGVYWPHWVSWCVSSCYGVLGRLSKPKDPMPDVQGLTVVYKQDTFQRCISGRHDRSYSNVMKNIHVQQSRPISTHRHLRSICGWMTTPSIDQDQNSTKSTWQKD